MTATTTPASNDANDSPSTFTKIFNKTTQYTDDSIKTFEHTFGKHYMSAGGQSMTEVMMESIAPSKGCSMLDIGFGIGGAAFDFYSKCGATIKGIDVGEQGVALAQAELKSRNEKRAVQGLEPIPISFELLDAQEATFAPESFDVIYSRDTFVHLGAEAKAIIFAKCMTWLKPGGKMCIADYSLGRNSYESGEPTPVFSEYLQARGYHMFSPKNYAKALVTAGLEAVESKDMAYWYCMTCQKELDRVAKPGESRDNCVAAHGEGQVSKLEKTYRDKIQMTLRGDRSYVLVTGTKQIPHAKLRQEVVDTYVKMWKDGNVLSCDGNVSARADGKNFLVTPTGIDALDMTADQIVLCDGNGKTTGKIRPTSEVDLHTLIYQCRPDVGGIVHSHSIYVCALACCRIPLPPAHYAVCELLCDKSKGCTQEGSVVKCSTYHTYGTFELATASLAALGDNYACLMANHGAVVVGKDLAEAMYLTERLERECEIYWRAQQIAKPVPLTPDEIQTLSLRNYTYGQEPEVDSTTTTKE